MLTLQSRVFVAAAVTLCLFSAPANAMADHDSTSIVAAVEKFHAALMAADTTTVKSVLGDDVIVLESGFLETRSEYLSHHLGADIEFSRAVPSERKVVSVHRNGNTAWIVSTSTTTGDFKGRPVNSQGTELMVLTRVNARWKIRAIHWSSAKRQK